MKLDITLFGALPFRRISKTAKRQRRTHLKKTAPTVTTCSNCGAVVASHRACTKCGYYKGKETIKVAKEETKKSTNVGFFCCLCYTYVRMVKYE